ncbi:cytochrome P450 CYP12A2-like isoform X1 [Rhagoletis pomonella]|uniref:cytochrome P450 CYP12A2-like isoform X1 n=1 Tax=Rhagoletis pomonella TaxID=28610 RepID=UPI001783AFB8|nr:cytochrome P450 CYP12A2-like isoform X1 [Rhagoletis pomonella]
MFSGKISAATTRKGMGIANSLRSTTLRLFATKKQPLSQHDPETLNSSCPVSAKEGTALEWQRARPFSEIPQIGALKLISKFLPGGKYFKLDSNDLVAAMRSDFGPIFMMPALMGQPSILVTYNPDDFENVFRNEGIWPIRPFSQTMRYYRNKYRADIFDGVEGAIASQGEQWNSFRTVVNPILLQSKSINMYLNKMAQVNQEFVDRIRLMRNSETLEMPDDFAVHIQLWALESVAVVALDLQLGLLREDSENSDDAQRLFNALNEFVDLSFQLDYKPAMWRLVATPKLRRLMRAMDDIRSVTWKHVTEAINRLEAEKREGVQRPEEETSILERIIKRDAKVAAVMSMDMLMAGVDTTATLVAGALLCLAQHPEKQERLRSEVRSVLPEKRGNFTPNVLDNIPYLRACIKESLRIYPVSVGNMRVPQNDLILSGYRVPKGTWVSMISSTLQSDERFILRPLEYLPERWLRTDETISEEGVRSLKPSNPFVYLPFGFGPRICLGRRIIDLEVGLAMARLVRNFKIEFNYPTDKPFKGMLINIPNIPLKFKLTDID